MRRQIRFEQNLNHLCAASPFDRTRKALRHGPARNPGVLCAHRSNSCGTSRRSGNRYHGATQDRHYGQGHTTGRQPILKACHQTPQHPRIANAARTRCAAEYVRFTNLTGCHKSSSGLPADRPLPRTHGQTDTTSSWLKARLRCTCAGTLTNMCDITLAMGCHISPP